MPKRIVVGVGGTGLEVIRNLRRRIVESYPETSLQQFPHLGFLYVDTDENAVAINEDNRKRWEVLGTSIQLRESEFTIVRAPAVGRILDDLQAYPQLRDWLPVEQLEGLNVAARDTPGAQQIRALGRMMFTLNSDTIKRSFTNALNSLQEDPAGGNPEVILACSLSGGTGAGMFLDLAYSLRQWLQGRGLTTGFLVLPDLMEEASRGRRYLANAYAALADLNYYSVNARRHEGQMIPIAFKLPAEEAEVSGYPFDFCYLVGTRNQLGEELTLDTLPDMIAHRILLKLDSAVSGDVAGMLNNAAMARTQALTDPKDGNVHSQYFSSFGLSTIQYPIEQITEILAYRLVDHAMKGWLEPPPVDNVNQRVVSQLPSLLLTDDHLLGNRDFFGQGQDYPAIPTDVERLLTERLNQTPTSNRAPHLNQTFAGFLDEFRGGLQRFYGLQSANLEGAADVIARKIREAISTALVDPALGYPYSIEAVEQLIAILEAKRSSFDAAKQKLPARIKASAVAKTAAIGDVTKAEGAILSRDSKIKAAMDKVRAAMGMNLTSQVEDRAYEYGMTLLSAMVVRLKALQTNVTDWRANLINLRKDLANEVNARSQSLTDLQRNTNRFNGTVLFRIERVQTIFEQFQHAEAANFIRNSVTRQREALAWQDDVGETQRTFFKAAVEWMNTRSAVRVTAKNVAQQLLEDYPGGTNQARHDILSRTYRRSAPFLEFDQNEIAIYRNQQGQAYDRNPQNEAYRAALMDDEQNRYREVAQIRHEIVAATNLTQQMVLKISDTQQIVFISEMTAFPIRVIKEVRALRDAYRAHTREKKSLPLHIQKTYHPPLGSLMLVSEQEVAQRYRQEENFLIGWTLGSHPDESEWIRVEVNPYEQRPEVRYRFSVSGASDFIRLAESRDEAFQVWMSGAAELQAARQRLGDEIDRYFQRIVDNRQRQAFAAKLYGALNAIRDQLVYGENDEVYRRYNEIRQRIVRRFNLVREGDIVPAVVRPLAVAATAPAGRSTPSASEEAFQKYVEIIAGQVKGKLTARVQEILLVKQNALALDPGVAQAIVNAAVSKYAPQEPDTPVAQYRAALRDALDIGAGQLSEDSEAALLDMQANAGISPDDAAAIEETVRIELGLKQG
jgi:hypothetical protein